MIACFCLTLYLAGNGRISLWDRDEPRYAQAAREMMLRGDLVVPTFNERPRFHKPILIYWLMMVAYHWFGVGEFAARFWSAIGGTMAVLLTYCLAGRLYGRRVAVTAALMLAVCPLVLVESKLATPDAVLLASLLGCYWALWELQRRPSLVWAAAFWTCLGLGLLIKGPVAIGVVATSVAVWLVLARRVDLLGRLHWLTGLALLAVILLPWCAAVYKATDGAFFREALGKHVVGRSLQAMEGHRGLPGYYMLTAAICLLPWSLGLPLAFGGVRQRLGRDPAEPFLLGWVIGPMVMLELVRTKLPHYYLPSYPALIILIARGMVEYEGAGRRVAASFRGRLRLAVAGTVLVAVGAGTVLAVTVWLPQKLAVPAVVLAGLVVTGGLRAVLLFARRADRSGWWTAWATCAAAGFVAAAWLLPDAEACRVARVAAGSLRRAADSSGASAALHRVREPSLVYYFGRPLPELPSKAELARYVHRRGTVLTLLTDRDVQGLTSALPNVVIALERRVEPAAIGPRPAAPLWVARLSRCSLAAEATVPRARQPTRRR